jgi:hypothetical protein
MNTLKTVFGKLFKEETQLASHEVELSLIEDFKKLGNSYFTQQEKFQKQIDIINNGIKGMQNEYSLLVKIASTVDSDYQKLRKQVLDLGLEVPTEVKNYYNSIVDFLKNDSARFKNYNK